MTLAFRVDINRECLRLLLGFLHEVSLRSEKTLMDAMNLAVVFAPTMFYIKGKKGQMMLKEVEMQVTSASTLKVMISSYEELFQVRESSFFLER
jgi:hypothetical protein